MTEHHDRRASILIVDDDPLFLQAMNDSIYLKAQNIRVATADSGQQALSLLSQYHYDVVFSDIYMPGIDGYGVLKGVHSLGRALPVVLMSGDHALATRAVQQGASAFLPKPIDRREFVAVLRQVLTAS
jgi:DNA-binding NtrC family response regulator